MKTIEIIEKNGPVIPRRKRVAAYARVSFDSSRMQHSLSAQVSCYSDLIQSSPEWEYAGVYADMYNQRLIQWGDHYMADNRVK